jgi:hypothetical protein
MAPRLRTRALPGRPKEVTIRLNGSLALKMAVSQPCRAKERARFLADFKAAAEEQCVLKYTPSFELVLVLLDQPSTLPLQCTTTRILRSLYT